MTVRVSVVVPTRGEDTLGRALRSCIDADEIVVDVNADDDFGYAARHRAIARATGDVICFLDSDDQYVPGAIDVIREHASLHVPTVFQMQYTGGGILWNDRIVRHGNVGTPMIVVPNKPAELGVWAEHAGAGSGGGDYTFLATTVSKMGQPVWIERVIALIRP